MKIVGLLLALALLAPASASADRVGRVTGGEASIPFAQVTTFRGDGGALAARVARAARVPAIPGEVWVTHESNDQCPAPACAWPLMGQMWIAPWTGTRTVEDRFIVLHELGHMFDFRVLTNADRERLAGLLHSRPWVDSDQHMMGGEKFADAYAACGLRLNLRRGWVVDEYMPTSMRAHRKVCEAIVALG